MLDFATAILASANVLMATLDSLAIDLHAQTIATQMVCA
jgi:hypothetical protein